METIINLANYSSIAKWSPHLGDIVIYHGWFTHWFGIVNGIEGNTLHIIKAGMPLLLMTMDDLDIQKNSIKVGLNKMKRSTGGKYSVMQTLGNTCTWYV